MNLFSCCCFLMFSALALAVHLISTAWVLGWLVLMHYFFYFASNLVVFSLFYIKLLFWLFCCGFLYFNYFAFDRSLSGNCFNLSLKIEIQINPFIRTNSTAVDVDNTVDDDDDDSDKIRMRFFHRQILSFFPIGSSSSIFCLVY